MQKLKIIIGKKEMFINFDSEMDINEKISKWTELLKNMLSCEKHNFEADWTWFENERARNDNWIHYPSHILYKCSICGLQSKYPNS